MTKTLFQLGFQVQIARTERLVFFFFLNWFKKLCRVVGWRGEVFAEERDWAESAEVWLGQVAARQEIDH